MIFLRYILPIGIAVSGVVLLVVDGINANSLWGACSLWGAALSVFFLNWLFRLGVSGDRERNKEADARTFLAEHGHWPDEDPSMNRRS